MDEPVYRSVEDAPMGVSITWCEACLGYVEDEGIGDHIEERHPDRYSYLDNLTDGYRLGR